MFVQITNDHESGSQDIFVLGEKLLRNEEGVYLIPGRLITGLKADELPAGFQFALLDQLPSGIGFYREDSVTVCRTQEEQSLQIKVTTTYIRAEWDGLYSLVSTMDMRRRLLEATDKYLLERFVINEQICELAYSFSFRLVEKLDLEEVIESICARVRWVEEKGNQQLLLGSFHPQMNMSPDE